MKISNSTQAPKPAAASGANGSARAGSATRQSGASTAAASTSASAASLSQLEAQFAQSDFNAAKVGQISADIAAGRYQVNASAVADGLLSSAAAVGGKSN